MVSAGADRCTGQWNSHKQSMEFAQATATAAAYSAALEVRLGERVLSRIPVSPSEVKQKQTIRQKQRQA